MKSFALLLLSLLGVAFCRDNSWDFLFFAQRWAGTAGYGQSLPSNLNMFTIHGLWPSRYDGSYPSYCNNSQPFDPNLIGPLVATMNVVWYNYQSGSSNDFWGHEWSKHGTCAESVAVFNSEYKFFFQVLQLHSKYNIVNALASQGITPSSSSNYRVSDISNAIKSSLGSTPAITCQNTSLGSSLMRLALCFSKSLSLVDCPASSMDNSCGTYAYMPPINSSEEPINIIYE